MARGDGVWGRIVYYPSLSRMPIARGVLARRRRTTRAGATKGISACDRLLTPRYKLVPPIPRYHTFRFSLQAMSLAHC